MSGSPYSSLKIIHHRDRLDDMRADRQPAPVQVQISIADRCNENCNFCAFRMDGYTSNENFGIIDPATGKKDNNPNRVIPYEKIIEILDDCVELGVKAIQITGGGEPTVHQDYLKVFKAVLDRGLDLALVSNGVRWFPETFDLLLRAKWVRISIDASNAATYSRMRSIGRWAFDRAIGNISRLAAVKKSAIALGQPCEVEVGTGFVVTKDNWREVLDAVRLFKAMGADNTRISALFSPDDDRYFESFHEEAAALCKEAEAESNDHFRVFNNFGERYSDLAQQHPDYSYCGYQHLNTFIGATLEVYRCCVLAYSDRGTIGSIANQRFKELWQSEQKRQAFGDFDATGCPRCMFNQKNRTILYALDESPVHVNYI